MVSSVMTNGIMQRQINIMHKKTEEVRLAICENQFYFPLRLKCPKISRCNCEIINFDLMPGISLNTLILAVTTSTLTLSTAAIDRTQEFKIVFQENLTT